MIFSISKGQIDSPYNIGLSVTDRHNHIFINHFGLVFSQFCKDLNLPHIYFKELYFENIFTDIEFNKLIPDDNDESFINKNFYPKIFPDLHKHENNRLDFHTKYCFTLDKSLTPEQTLSGINFGSLVLGKKPVLYYIWSDIQEIIKLVKET